MLHVYGDTSTPNVKLSLCGFLARDNEPMNLHHKARQPGEFILEITFKVSQL